jgi:hypothetical protein
MTKTLDKPRLPRRSVAKAGRKAPRTRSKRPHKSWSPERRAKQAELIRSTKPWLKSTGPRTQKGKARAASNALKHGFRSRGFIEQVRQERQLIRDTGAIIALAKTILRTVEARSMRVPHITVWSGDPDLDNLTVPRALAAGPPLTDER